MKWIKCPYCNWAPDVAHSRLQPLFITEGAVTAFMAWKQPFRTHIHIRWSRNTHQINEFQMHDTKWHKLNFQIFSISTNSEDLIELPAHLTEPLASNSTVPSFNQKGLLLLDSKIILAWDLDILYWYCILIRVLDNVENLLGLLEIYPGLPGPWTAMRSSIHVQVANDPWSSCQCALDNRIDDPKWNCCCCPESYSDCSNINSSKAEIPWIAVEKLVFLPMIIEEIGFL